MSEHESDLEADPCEDVYLSEIQLESLLRYVKETADEARRTGAARAVLNELIVRLLLQAGLRPGELCNLNIGDLPATHGESEIWIRDKTATITRKVDVDTEVVKSLKKFVKLYRSRAGPDDPLFLSERSTRLSYMSLYSKIRIIGQRAGIAKLRPQMLRHTYLVGLYGVTQDLRLVQLQAGHASSTTTARYAKCSRRKMDAETCPGGVAAEKNHLSASQPRFDAIAGRAAASSESGQATAECEACGKAVAVTATTRIDSGQLLCPSCAREIRGK